jgi:hypothetical protein
MIRKNTFLIMVVFALSLGCSKQTEKVPEPVEITDLSVLQEILDEFDSTGQLKESAKDAESALKVLKGKELCSCYPHDTGQAHFHTKNTIAFSRTHTDTPLIGLLKKYIPTIDVDHKPGLKPCYLLFVNTMNQHFTDCQHISDTLGHDAFKVECVLGGRVQIAYDLNPVSMPHPPNNTSEDCH